MFLSRRLEWHVCRARLLSDCISNLYDIVVVSPPTVAVLFTDKLEASAKISSNLSNGSVQTITLHVYFEVLCCPCGMIIPDVLDMF